MNDLFSDRTSSDEKFGEVRGVSELLFGSPNGKGKFGSTELSLPTRSEKFGPLPFPVQQGSRRKSFGDLRETARRLMDEIEIAEAESAHLRAIQEPFSDSFRAANATLEDLWAARKTGSPVGKVRMLAAYTARLIAGHKWHPHRERYQTNLRWLKALRMELKDVNAEIGT
jgi:hypothetical protein